MNTAVLYSANHLKRLAGLALVALAVGVWTAGCGSANSSSTGSAGPGCHSLPRPAKAALAKLPRQSGKIFNCGSSGFKNQIEALRGYPVVVNKWASWCGPCRFEFPFFRRLATEHAGKVAFLGLDSEDSKSDALEFLKKFPVPYPSFFDPDSKVATVFRGQRVFPTTAYYDSKGELVLTKQGGYSSLGALEQDIERYAK